MTMKHDRIVVQMSSSMDDYTYAAFARAVEESIEQIACDHAAAQSDDSYEVQISFGEGRS